MRKEEREYKEYDTRIRKSKAAAKKRSFTVNIIKTLCTAILITILFGSFYTSAHNNRTEEPVNFKYYKSITIEAGDSLWSIAREYRTDDYSSTAEYIEVLKKINHLYDDHIQEGQKLIVAYNDTTFIE